MATKLTTAQIWYLHWCNGDNCYGFALPLRSLKIEGANLAWQQPTKRNTVSANSGHVLQVASSPFLVYLITTGQVLFADLFFIQCNRVRFCPRYFALPMLKKNQQKKNPCKENNYCKYSKTVYSRKLVQKILSV
jgi:hypothetical protein